jgi:hypothetical protein
VELLGEREVHPEVVQSELQELVQVEEEPDFFWVFLDEFGKEVVQLAVHRTSIELFKDLVEPPLQLSWLALREQEQPVYKLRMLLCVNRALPLSVVQRSFKDVGDQLLRPVSLLVSQVGHPLQDLVHEVGLDVQSQVVLPLLWVGRGDEDLD